MSTNTVTLIDEHLAIWREFHEPSGITLAESKRDWLDLLNDDPQMLVSTNWGECANAHDAQEIAAFREWLEAVQ